MAKSRLTKQEIILAFVFAGLGFLASEKSVLLFLGGLNPVQGFAFYYVILFTATFIMSKLGLTVFDVEIKRFGQVLGTVMIFFAFFLIVNWTNPYVQYVTTGTM